MKISYNWLKDYVDVDLSPEEVGEKLTFLGLEVEEIHETGNSFDGVVVGHVLECVKHPGADRLKLCKVDTGSSEPVQIVCGAPNVEAGQKVPVATVGAVLPIVLDNGKNLKIKKGKIRGEVSEGMICAEDELGLGDNHDGIMVLDNSLAPGTPFAETLSNNVDHVFEIGLTPNRPDAACHIGVARDLSAVVEKPLKKPSVVFPDNAPALPKSEIEVIIERPEKCHHFVGLIIRGIQVGESPDWLKARLEAVGLRSINNVVDATNFVMLETGQPLHAYDLHQIADRKIVVTDYSEETTFTTLDGVERKVPAGTLYICDGEKPVGIGGIMGGLNSEIEESTTDVFLEAAYFEPVNVRKSSKALTLQTDASYRFERGVDPNGQRFATVRCAEMIVELAGGAIDNGIVDVHPKKTEALTVKLRVEFLNRLLGTAFTGQEAGAILERLQFGVEGADTEVLTCTVPTFRPDVSREVDLVEEVARVFDYNKIPSPKKVNLVTPSPYPYRERFIKKVRSAAVSLGFNEIYTNSLLPRQIASLAGDEDSLVKTMNPISKDQEYLRDSLVWGFLRSAAHNFNRSIPGVRFFEVGNVFTKAEQGTFHKGYDEKTHALLGIAGQKRTEHWETGKPAVANVFDLKSAVDQWLRGIGVSQKLRTIYHEETNEIHYLVGKNPAGRIFEIPNALKTALNMNGDAFAAEFVLDELMIAGKRQGEIRYKPIPVYPSFEFDLAIIVATEVPAGKLENQIRSTAGKWLERIEVFDVYEGESIGAGNKSIAFRLTFRDQGKTLSIKEINPIINKVLATLQKQFSARLRS